MATKFLSATYKHFENVTDPRVDRGCNYPLIEMIFVPLCATLCGADGWADVERFGKAKLDWLRNFLPFENGIPSHDTFGRVFRRLDSVEFYAALQSWVGEIATSLHGQTVAVDGKTLRGSFDSASQTSALHSVSAWACGLRLCLGLNSVDDKSNEIPAVQELASMLDLAKAVVTADAMHCQKATAEAIVDKEADYLLFVKGNQPTLQDALHEAICNAFDNDDPRIRSVEKRETNRGRSEMRGVSVMPVPKRSQVFSRWPGIKTIGMTYRTREVNGQMQESVHTFITSLSCGVRNIATRLRQHWSIENQQHYMLDVTFAEDSSRIRKGSGPEIASAFRRLALSILQQDTTMKDSIRGKRIRCGWDNSAMQRLIAYFSTN